jgi:sterol desaturase/sphingolipid hydroxylase (fatty acid hydroxylase superfamily)
MLFELLTAPAEKFIDPSERVFWGYLFNPIEQLRRLFNPKYWLSRSSLYDMFLLIFNTIMRLTLIIPFFGSHVVVTVLVGGFLQEHIGDAPDLNLGWFWIATIFSISFLVLDDLSRFILHFCMHRFDFLWYFHKTHHSATVLTPLTIFRVHPVEHILYFSRRLIVFGFVTGVFIWLFSHRLIGLQILGVDMFGVMFNFAAANLRHSHIWISFGRLEKIFISPAQHQIHHSVGNSNANLGSIFSVWDGLLGTRTYSGQKRELEFGLGPEKYEPRNKEASGLVIPTGPSLT